MKSISFPRIADSLEKMHTFSGKSYARGLFPGSNARTGSNWTNDLGLRSPCVLYEAKPTFEVTQVSSSIEDLLGIGAESIASSPGFWKEWLFDDDLPLIEAKLQELENSDFVSFAHRMFSGVRLPIWVSHSLMKDENEGTLLLRGCLLPIFNDSRICALDHTLVTRFIHELGNQFQLLNLVTGSLKKDLPNTRDSELLLETLDKAGEITQSFADCTQVPAWLSEIQFAAIFRAAIDNQRDAFNAKAVLLEEHYDERLDEAIVSGDPFLLETAMNHVIADALRNVTAGGTITIKASIDTCLTNTAVARLQLVESQRYDGPRYRQPRGYPKQEHAGVRLTMAARLIEIHGGLLRIFCAENKANGVDISLPIAFQREHSCA